MSKKPKILSVKIEHAPDTDPDLSWLGEYSNHYAPGALDREKRGDAGRGEYCYWIPSPNHYPHKPSSWARVSDRRVAEALRGLSDAEREQACRKINWPARYDRAAAIRFLDECYVERDYRRHESICRGDVQFLGVIAKARVQLAGSDTQQTLRSAGLWGVESDAGDYLREVEREELAALRAELSAVGCTERQIDKAYKNVEYPDY